MSGAVAEIAFSAVALVLAGSAEEILPRVFGVGFPVLLGFALAVGTRRPLPCAAAFALAAGSFEDALSSLPPMTSASFAVLAVLAARTNAAAAALLAYPLYQAWLAAWTGGIGGSVFARMAVALPVGAVTAVAAAWAVATAERRAAIAEQG